MIRILESGSADELARIERHLAESFGDQVERVSAAELADSNGLVFLPWIRRPRSIAPLGSALRLLLRGRRARWIDIDGRHGDCGPGFFVWQGARWIAFCVLDAMLRALASGIVRLPPPRTASRPNAGANVGPQRAPVLVLPILPDLSHTFIYREAARLLELEPDARLIVLERGAAEAPDHPEVRQLLQRAEFLPMRGVFGRSMRALFALLRAPRRAGVMLRHYRSERTGLGALFGKLPFRDPRHPGRSFELACLLGGWSAQQPSSPLHVYGSTYAANVVMGAALLLDRRYSITSYVDFDFHYEHRMLRPKYATSEFFRVCTAFCAERMRDLLPEATPERLPIVLFGLDLTRWRGGATPQNRGVLFTACRLVPKKGLRDIPPALAELQKAQVPFRWRIAGDGPERFDLERLCIEHSIEDHVDFLGALPTDAVARELQQADLALLPCVVAADGERDGIPIFLTEAMALGVPILTTPVSGIPELVHDGRTGFLTEPGDPIALAKRLREVLRDAPTRARVAAAGREFVHANLDLDVSARRLRALICGDGS